MSYKKKKLKKGLFNQLKRKLRLVKIALLKKYKLFIQKNKTAMQQRQTTSIVKELRERAKAVRSNNLKINEWVDSYIEACILNGKPVELLTQYCLSKDLENRYDTQGGVFIPLPAEVEMFSKNIPTIIEMFKSNNVSVNWYVTFNNSFLERGRVSDVIVDQYMRMIESLSINNEITFFNWEKDILGKQPEPSRDVLQNFTTLVSKEAFEIDMRNLIARVKQYKNFTKTEDELRNEAMFKIACEAEEGNFIFSENAPFSMGNILITPLEFPERLVFFEILAPEFQKRIVPILKLYPWRMDAENLKYSNSD